MKKLFVLFALLLLALNLSACSDSDDTPTVASPTYSIAGTVTVNGAPLADATVVLSGDKNKTATTDAQGAYTFSDLEAGDYTVTPSTATGYSYAPENIAITTSNADVAGQNFTATWVSAAVYLHYTLPNQYQYEQDGGLVADEVAALFSDYDLTAQILYSGTAGDPAAVYVSGYALDQFIDEDSVLTATPDPEDVLGVNDPRALYSYILRSNQDGFTNRTKFVGNGLYNIDLAWDMFNQGYVLDLNYTGKSFFPASLGLAKMFNTKYTYDVYMFRKIDVKRPDAAGTIATFEPQATTDNYVSDTTYTTTTGLSTTKFTVETKNFGDYANVKAISLDQFITDYITDSPNSYTYTIVALDGSTRTGWTYDNMQNAYYLVDLDLIVRVSATDEVVADTKINFPVRIELVTDDGNPVEYDYSAKNPPAFAKAYNE
ncbi:MAG: carboxypeptidase-like regulatory domain-containing protein [Desulfobacteraceae bacterium]